MKTTLTLVMILVASMALGQQIKLSKSVTIDKRGLTINKMTFMPEAGYSNRLKSNKFLLTVKFDLNDIKKTDKKRDSSIPKTKVYGGKWWIKAKKDTVRIRR